MIDWADLIDLILNSIQIIGVFIAIIIGLIISKVIEINNEKNSLKEAISDIDDELKFKKQQFEEFKNINYAEYEEDVIDEILDSICEDKEYVFYEYYAFVEIEYQKNFYKYVKEYISKIKLLTSDGKSKEACRKELKIEEDSIEEVILNRIC